MAVRGNGIDPRSVDRVIRTLEDTLESVKRDVTYTGMAQAVLLVKRTAMLKTPVDTGNLKSSYDTDVIWNRSLNGSIVGEIRNTAEYAAQVHEMPGTLRGKPRSSGKGYYWDPGGDVGPKFLERALNEEREKVLRLLIRSALVR